MRKLTFLMSLVPENDRRFTLFTRLAIWTLSECSYVARLSPVRAERYTANVGVLTRRRTSYERAATERD